MSAARPATNAANAPPRRSLPAESLFADRLLPVFMGAFALLVGAAALWGWLGGPEFLTDWDGSDVRQKANNALAMMLAGLALLLLSLRRGAKIWPRALAGGAALIGGLTFFEHVTGVNLGIDTLIVDEAPGAKATVSPGRMGPIASLSHFMIGSALLLCTGGARARRAAQALAMLTLIVIGIPLVGYLYGADFLHTVPRVTAIAFQTTIVFLALSLGVLAIVPEHGVVSVLRRPDPGGKLLRRLLPLLVLLPLALGWLRLRGEQLGLFDAAFGTAALTFLLVMLFGAIATAGARRVGRDSAVIAEKGERLRTTLASIGDGVITTDAAGVVTMMNPVAERLTGWSAAEAVGRPLGAVFRIVNEATREEVVNPAWRAISEGAVVGLANHTVLISRDGSERPIDDAAAPIRPDGADPIGCVLIFRDVTERRAAERSLRESEQFRRILVEQVTDYAIFRTDRRGVATSWNEGVLRVLGFEEHEFVGVDVAPRIFTPEAIRNGVPEAELTAAAASGSATNDRWMRRRNGEVFWASGTTSALRDENGEVLGFTKVMRDLTDRKQSEEALSAALTELRTTLETAATGLTRCSRDLRYLSANPAYAEITGLPLDEIAGRPIAEVIGDAAFAVIRPHIERVLRGERVEYEAELPFRASGRRWLHVVYTPYRDGGAEVVGWVASVADISRRKRAEAELRIRGEQLQTLLDRAPVGVFTVDADFRIRSVNPIAMPAFGRLASEVVGRDLGEVMHVLWEKNYADEVVRIFRHTLDTGESYETQERAEFRADRRRVEHYRWRVDRITLADGRHGLVCYFSDIAEQIRAREEIQRERDNLKQLVEERTAEALRARERVISAERLAAMGTLAAGLGHDMGNLLLPVRVRIESLERMDIPEGAAEELEGIRSSMTYLQKLASGLRMLAVDADSGAGRPTESTRIRAWWDEAEPVLRNALPHGVELRSDIDTDDCCVPIAATPLMHAAFNLVQNAGDAMRASGGAITVSSRAEGDEMVITFVDTGPGMSDEVKRRCMEPFFSTKTRGISTGLGLAFVYGIVQKSGGRVELESQPGKGAAFALRFPRARQSSDGADRPERTAIVDVDVARTRAYVISELKRSSYQVSPNGERATADLAVLDRPRSDIAADRVVRLAKSAKMSEVRAAMLNALLRDEDMGAD